MRIQLDFQDKVGASVSRGYPTYFTCACNLSLNSLFELKDCQTSCNMRRKLTIHNQSFLYIINNVKL